MTELEHRYAKISLLKVGIAIIGFFLLMSVAVTRCLFNEKGIMNIVTTTTYLLKEQQYYNQIICVSAKDAGFNQNETNKLMIGSNGQSCCQSKRQRFFRKFEPARPG